MGTGKSTVAAMFRRLGAMVLDADALAHQAMEPKRLAWRYIVKAFGEEILNEDQTVNRRKLAAVVFQDEDERKRLEAIIHPQVLRAIKQELHQLRRSRRVQAVVLDVPLLLEVGAKGWVDALVVVTAPPAVQRERLKRKYAWSDADINARVAAQWDLSAKEALADDVVDNSDGVDATRTQVKRIWNQRVLLHRRKTPRGTPGTAKSRQAPRRRSSTSRP